MSELLSRRTTPRALAPLATRFAFCAAILIHGGCSTHEASAPSAQSGVHGGAQSSVPGGSQGGGAGIHAASASHEPRRTDENRSTPPAPRTQEHAHDSDHDRDDAASTAAFARVPVDQTLRCTEHEQSVMNGRTHASISEREVTFAHVGTLHGAVRVARQGSAIDAGYSWSDQGLALMLDDTPLPVLGPNLEALPDEHDAHLPHGTTSRADISRSLTEAHARPTANCVVATVVISPTQRVESSDVDHLAQLSLPYATQHRLQLCDDVGLVAHEVVYQFTFGERTLNSHCEVESTSN